MIVRRQVHLTYEELQEHLAYWQSILRLDNWDVVARISRAFELPPDIQGRCEPTLKSHQALIRILDPVDWDPEIIYPQDMETTLVHELLHLHSFPFDTFEDDTAENTALEQMIHHSALALTYLDRKHPSVLRSNAEMAPGVSKGTGEG